MDPFFNLLVGLDGGSVVFCHTLTTPGDRRKWLDLEMGFHPGLTEDRAALDPIFRKLGLYFGGDDSDPADIGIGFSRGTPFERKVWSTLRTVKKGHTISYQQLGEKAGFPSSQRAVGQAMAKNHLLLFVPCHRVVSKTGDLGGFSAGKEKKAFLLRLEKTYRDRAV